MHSNQSFNLTIVPRMATLEAIEIQSQRIRLELHKIVEEKLKSKNYEINLSLASKTGVNSFIGIVYRAAFRKKGIKRNENYPDGTLIVKVAPQQLNRREKFQIRPLFLREIYMYEKVSAIDSFK